MSDLYNTILQLIRQNGYREFEKEFMNVKEYMKEEARYILGLESDIIVEKKEENVVVNNIDEERKEEKKEEVKEIKMNDNKEIKLVESGERRKTQREKERYRREENKRNNISESDVLTVENVREWIGEGRSFAWIASEKVGCKQEEVSRFAKLHGIV